MLERTNNLALDRRSSVAEAGQGIDHVAYRRVTSVGAQSQGSGQKERRCSNDSNAAILAPKSHAIVDAVCSGFVESS
jgi:hypothetical protein